MNTEILAWLRSGDTGMSSLTIAAVMEQDATIAAMNRGHGSHPLDPSDLGRCLRLLDIVPSYRQNLQVMKSVSPQWNVLITHWEELEALYREELPSGVAQKCYRRMYDLLHPDHPRDWAAEDRYLAEHTERDEEYR